MSRTPRTVSLKPQRIHGGSMESRTAPVSPESRKLTERQSKRLGALAGIEPQDLVSRAIVDIADRMRWRIDPELLWFRRVCGKVVKKDPATGAEYPVPLATVKVEDVDCDLIGYFPPGWPWGWFFPFNCHREVLATVRTDECGRFCARIPRFDIDWIVRWRKARVCFPVIFRRPSPVDLGPLTRWPRPPWPDPGPLRVVDEIRRGGRPRVFGAPTPDLDEPAHERGFHVEMPPPLPEEFRRVLSGQADVASAKKPSPHEAIRSAVAAHLGISRDELQGLDVRKFIGPFLRCEDVRVPTWQRILDVPDIAFTVTQDTNGDGVEEPIYSESYFDVRWDSGPIADVKLYANASAKESHVCEVPTVTGPTTDAALQFVGLMPLDDPSIFENGYAKRPNRPKAVPNQPDPDRPAAETPLLGTLQLYGWVNIAEAESYRVLRSVNDGSTFAPITGLSWNIYPKAGGTAQTVSPDADGWYKVLPDPDAFHPARMVLEWPTPFSGKQLLKLEIRRKHGKNAESVPVPIQVDNGPPTVVFNELAWKFESEGDAAFAQDKRNLLLEPCPTIHRGAAPQTVEVSFKVSVTALHLRQAYLYSGGCGQGSFSLNTAQELADHWHDDVNDNAVVLSGRYTLDATALEGAYAFGCYATSRGMNPDGGDGGHLDNWFYDPVNRWSQPEVRVAVVNAKEPQ